MGYVCPMFLLGTFHWFSWYHPLSSWFRRSCMQRLTYIFSRSRAAAVGPIWTPLGGERSVPLEQGVRRARPTAHTAAIAGFVLVSGHGT